MTKIIKIYIAYELHDWAEIPLKNFTLENCLFGATNITKNSDKDKWVYSGYGIAFDGWDKRGFGNGTAGIMEALVHQRKNLVLILLKQIQNFPWVYNIMLIIVICLLLEKK